MSSKRIGVVYAILMAVLSLAGHGFAQKPIWPNSPVTVNVYDRTRVDGLQWFAAPPATDTYGYVESLLRISVSQRIKNWDWQLELAQPSVLGAPNDAFLPPGNPPNQLGFGATYYAANGNERNSASAFLKQGFVRYKFGEPGKSIRVGRFEFNDGQETSPQNKTIVWLQNNRISQRLIGNFGFSAAQRSFDGVDGHYGRGSWDLTGFAARADQGVFNMNGNPQLNVDLQYAAFTKSELKNHVLWRVFGLAYHDGRTGITKTDNRPLAVRNAEALALHQNIRVGTYGGDVLASVPAGAVNFDFLLWGVAQTGSWGTQDHLADAEAVEAGVQFTKVPTKPWVRGGWFRGSGDENNADGEHGTFFQVLPTPRVYAQMPFYNLMNSTDEFVQIIDTPCKNLSLRSDLHFLQLTSGSDLWYQGGGAFDNRVFGYVGRSSGGNSSFATVADIAANWQATKTVGVNLYYAHVFSKSAIKAFYPTTGDANYGYAELVYKWGAATPPSAK
jgi:alginate export protein